ncbi:hypothetical protein [Flavobacterium sp. 3HN19-14]|uniref:hypothetical protein n=1 Tax=Flavobacterium sp. 3HN19-14 TaxID=3448133 RepID=UPI003EE16FF8
MKIYRRILIIAGSVLFVLVLLHIGVNFWVTTQLPKIINRENDSAYNIKYDKIEISLINASIHAEKIVVTPKYAIKDSLSKTGIYANVKAVDVLGFSIWNVIFSNKLKARSIRVTQPDVVLYKKSEKAIDNSKSISSEVVKPFEKIIAVSDIFLDKGNVKILNILNNKTILNARNINVKLQGIVITDDILERKIPFSYKTYAFDCDSIFYQPSKFYQITTQKVKTTEKGINVKNFAMLPQYSRKEFLKNIRFEKDIYTLKAKDIDIRGMEWGYKDTVFFFHSKAVELDQVAADIYRSKLQDDDMTKKKLYNKLLRDLKFDLDITTLKLRNSYIMYEEEKAAERAREN